MAPQALALSEHLFTWGLPCYALLGFICSLRLEEEPTNPLTTAFFIASRVELYCQLGMDPGPLENCICSSF